MLAYNKRGSFVLSLVRQSKTLRVYITWLPLALMFSCAREIHMLYFKGILVAYLGVRALCCLEIVVAGCWLYHFGPHPAVGLP